MRMIDRHGDRRVSLTHADAVTGTQRSMRCPLCEGQKPDTVGRAAHAQSGICRARGRWALAGVVRWSPYRRQVDATRSYEYGGLLRATKYYSRLSVQS